MLVCHCRGITDRQIRRLVKDGACSTREVARSTGAGMRCGGCRSNVKQVVNDAVEAEFQKTRPTLTPEITLFSEK
jgi:bacterioferritin-associated ferredoxin